MFCFDLRPRRTKNAAEAPPTQRATQKTIEGKVRTKESGAASCSLIYIYSGLSVANFKLPSSRETDEGMRKVAP